VDVKGLSWLFHGQVREDSDIWVLSLDDSDDRCLKIGHWVHFIILYFRARIIISTATNCIYRSQ
jgi:hypothetical protein